jgi:PKD repeat protein
LATNSGGGAAYSELNDCALTNNWAAIGGASFYGALNNCPLFGNSATNSGGGSFGSALRDCSLIHNSAQEGAGLDSGTANNCTFTGNSAFNGGATAYSALNDCTLTANSATTGGAVYYGTLNKCVFIGNAAINSGGGAFGGTLNICALSDNSAQEGAGLNSSTANNCTITGNSAFNGGGAAASKLNGCILTNNSALNLGGGALESTLNSCALNANSASSGGGAFDCALTNCTVTANSAFYNGGGVSFSTLNNCIAYFNTAVQWANYDSGSLLDYSCTMPLPTNGVGNISSNPLLANAFHLSAYSPCRGAGNAAYATGTDIDGEFWASPPSIGCDEYYTASATGDLVVAIITPFTSVTVGLPLEFTTLIAGRTTASSWDFGDGVTATNQLIVSHSWAGLGDYSLVLRAFNESNPEGISATVTIHVVPRPVYYVSVDSLNPVAPYSSWATAATDIQDAVDVATVAGSQVLVTNGIYARGARLTVGDAIVNRLVVDKPLSLQSVNGPQFTIIDGGRSNRCVHLAYYASLSGFTLTNGLMQNDGAVFGGALTNCTLTGNNGASYCTLTYCSLTNWAGASYCTLNNCMLTANPGVGASYSTLNNCMLSSNYVAAEYSTLNNCTLTGNEAYGALGCAMTNCIAYFNTAAPGVNYDALSTLNYCCTTPLPANGVGNISSDPQLASAWRLSAASPCRGAGSAVSAIGTDLDGEAWANPPSIGCDEYHAGALTGPLSVGITSSFTNVPIGFTLQLVGTIEGRPASNSWDFGDGITATNQLYVSHTWAALGDYAVILNAYNTGNPDGVSTTITIHVVPQPIHYVVANSLAPVAPYTSWATAARNIQDAVDAATVPAALVLVSNGTYAAGGRADELAVVIVDKPLTVRSINGPLFTAINGNGTNRCVTLLKEAIISGFTLTNGLEGAALGIVTNCTLGGNAVGASFSTLYNCTLTENNAYEYGGGAYASTLYNCTLSRNSCLYGGGGAYACTLNNCTLTDNDSFPLGGGAMNCTLNNCIAYFNTGGNYQDCSLNNCCTTPDPGGIGNFTSPPLFVNQASGNLRLQTNSPCINAGNNIFAVGSTDLDDNPRIQGGAVDIGAYEFQSPLSMISYAWLQQFNLPIHPSTDTADPDGDGLNNWQEWRCGTDPTNALSALRMLALAGGGTNVMVSWQSVTGVSYLLERATSLATPAAFASLASNIHGQPGTTSYADTNAIGAGPWFYRVGIGSP